MAAHLNNKYAVKLITSELKIEAYLDYCRHVSEGMSKDTWFYEKDGELLCSYKTMETYMREEAEEFPSVHMERARALSKRLWESRGLQMMDGKRHAEPAIYQMFMRNKFGWDRPDRSEAAEDGKTDLKAYAQALKDQRALPQEPVANRSE